MLFAAKVEIATKVGSFNSTSSEAFMKTTLKYKMAKNRVKRMADPIFYLSLFFEGPTGQQQALDTGEPNKCDLVECLHASN